MKALILGGNRFFGKHLASFLLQSGCEVTLLNRGNINDGFGNKIKRVVADRKTLTENDLPVQNWDIVYDQVCFDAHEAQNAVNIFRNRTDKYVFTSSQSIYGDGSYLTESLFEPSLYHFETIADPRAEYGEAKRQAESVFARRFGPKVVLVRFPFVLGEDDYTKRLDFHVDRVATHLPIFFPARAAKISMIHAKDAGRFLSELADPRTQTAMINGPINVCAKEPIALDTLLNLIEKSTGKSALVSSGPGAGDPSPYGVDADGYMSVSKLEQFGFQAAPILEWIPGLIERLVSKAGQ